MKKLIAVACGFLMLSLFSLAHADDNSSPTNSNNDNMTTTTTKKSTMEVHKNKTQNESSQKDQMGGVAGSDATTPSDSAVDSGNKPSTVNPSSNDAASPKNSSSTDNNP